MSGKKRERKARVSTYLEPHEKELLKAFKTQHKCDAAAVVRAALKDFLGAGETAPGALNLQARAIRDQLRNIVQTATWVLQRGRWEPVILPPDQPLVAHFDAAVVSALLADNHERLREVALRVAALHAVFIQPSDQSNRPEGDDTSPRSTKKKDHDPHPPTPKN